MIKPEYHININYDYTDFWNRDLVKKSQIADCAPGTYYWQDTDNLESFNSNPKPGYTETSITYYINSHGFRGPEFSELADNGRPKILALGCSYTKGVGVTYEDIWSTKLNKYFPDHDVINFGLSGGTADSISRYCYLAVEHFKPRIVAALWPEISRVESYYRTENNMPFTTTYGIWNHDHYFPMHGDEHYLNLRRKNEIMLELLSHKYQFQLIQYATNKGGESPGIEMSCNYIDQGRDDHPGPLWHQKTADRFYEQYLEVIKSK
jgi:hypothetical protein